MEKFAIDLDKVLDDFEFNEDCAEQIASVNPAASIVASSSGNRCNLETPPAKAYNYLVIDPPKVKAGREFEIIPSSEKLRDAQPASTENSEFSQNDASVDNLSYGKAEEGLDSLNHFYMHDCRHDSKLVQKQTVPPYDSEQVSLTIYNDISQKLLQKQQNGGGGGPKIDNRYDKKLNQPNIKPSVSNVFSSLNEYINAPPGGLDYVRSVVEDDTDGPNLESCNVGEVSVNSATKHYKNLVTEERETCNKSNRNLVTEEQTNTVHIEQKDEGVSITIGSKDATAPENQDPASGSAWQSRIRQANAGDSARNSSDPDRTEERQNCRHVSITAINAREPEYKYEEPSAAAAAAAAATMSDSERLDSAASATNQEPELRMSMAGPSEETKGSEPSEPPQENQDQVGSRVYVEQKVTVEADEGETVNRNGSEEGRRVLGFSNMEDLSEEELTKYLAELEEEQEEEEVNEVRRDEDAHEAPIFESVTIGELPTVSQERLSEKAKKFPVIDYSENHQEEAPSGAQPGDTWPTIQAQDSVTGSSSDPGEDSRKTEQEEVVAEDKDDAERSTNQDSQDTVVQDETNGGSKESEDQTLVESSTREPGPPELERSLSTTEDDPEKPVRPQTLDIGHQDSTIGSSSNAGSTSLGPQEHQEQTDGVKEDHQHGSPSPELPDPGLLDTGVRVLGKRPPFWVPDSEAPSCMLCDAKFTVLKRRHHCRACGKVLCNKCCSMKYKLEYQGNIDSRVCVSCYQLLTKGTAESDHGMENDWPSSYTGYTSNTDINSPQGRQPNPNNPMEYCSTVPPLQQLAGVLPPTPTVMVPVGVLKRDGAGTGKHRPEGSKSVMFSDELDTSWDLRPPYRKSGSNKRAPVSSSSSSSSTTGTRRPQNSPRIDPVTESYVPQDPDSYPPTVTMHKGQVTYHAVTDEAVLYKTLKNECEPPVMFAINRNLYVYVKITNLNCCVNKICWNVTSRGLACVGQDEVILLVETLPDETRIPKDLLLFVNQLYTEAIKGNTVTELGFSVFHGGNLLGSREHAGFLFVRQTLQCLQKIVLPPAPFLVGLLVHRWETPWAKVFPLRLLLRLGAEYRYYPCPLVSVRFRDALYFEIGHTVMKVLADFRNFGYTLPGVRGLTIHLRNRMTDVMFPRNRYDQVIKGLNNSNDHVLAYASNFSIAADSHLVCIQASHGDESSYQTQAINIHNKPRTVTGASFIVINGALKSSMGLSAKSSIVEDGLMVEIMPEKMEALKAALKNMQEFTIGCGRQGAPEPDETVNIKWVDNDVQFNLGVKSPIDGQPMDGVPSIRVHNGTDYKGTSRFIRWTEVFIIKSDDHPNGVHDPVDINKLSGNIARATCTALVKLLDLLATAGLTKLAVRTTIHPDNVGYEAGSEGTKLPPIYMNSLDNELIQVLHKAAQSSQDTHTVLELIFYILDD